MPNLKGLTGDTCEMGLCQLEATYYAQLVDQNFEICARRPLCEIHAQEMFGVNIDQMARKVLVIPRQATYERERELDCKVEEIIRAQQMDDRSDNKPR